MNDIQFTQALTKAMPMLTGYSRNLIAEVSDADDLLQHTLLKAWDNRDKFYDTGSFYRMALYNNAEHVYQFYPKREVHSSK